MFLRDKPNLLSEIRRATHYGVAPEKQEVDDLRSEVGSLRLQVTDMDGRIDALSRMVDRLLEERSVGIGNGSSVVVAGVDGVGVKHEIPTGAGWAKKRRLDGEWDATPAADTAERGVVRVAAGPPCAKMETGEDSGVPEVRETSSALVKAEPTENPTYQFSVEAAGGTAAGDAVGEEMIIGGGPLCRDSSFLRDLDNMSIGSAGSGSLGPLELIDVTAGDDRGSGGNGGGLDFFDLDFEAEITSMPGSEPGLNDQQEQEPFATSPAVSTAAERAAPVDGVVIKDQEARIEELTASLDSMPAESRRKLAEGLLTLAQNPGVVSTFAKGGAAGAANIAASATGTESGSAVRSAAAVANGGGRVPATEAPEIAMPLASAALGAFMVHYAQAKAVKEPASSVAAVAMDASRHALKSAASSR